MTPRWRLDTSAVLVATATAGVLTALGGREGDALLAFRGSGRLLLAMLQMDTSWLTLSAVALGALHHILLASLWGAALGAAVRPLRGGVMVAGATFASLLFALANLWMFPPVLRVGYAVITTTGQALPLALATVVALLLTPWASRSS